MTNAEARFNKIHIRKVYACLAVTCHLHFWQNDRDFLRATVVTRGWNGYRNKSQHRKCQCQCHQGYVQHIVYNIYIHCTPAEKTMWKRFVFFSDANFLFLCSSFHSWRWTSSCKWHMTSHCICCVCCRKSVRCYPEKGGVGTEGSLVLSAGHPVDVEFLVPASTDIQPTLV